MTDNRITELKKKILSKKMESFDALVELKEIVKQALESRETNEAVVSKLNEVNDSIKGIKQPDLNGIINRVEKIRPIVNINTNDIVDVLKALLEKEVVQVTAPQKIVWPTDPKDAIPVVLTDKTKKEFYNALASIATGFMGGIDTSNLATKVLQTEMIDAINNIEINADSINLNTDDLEALLTAIKLLLEGTLKVEVQNPLDVSALATSSNQTDGSQQTKVTNMLVAEPFDSIYATYPTTSSEVYTYKLATVTVAIVTVSYSDPVTKEIITSVVRT